MIEDMKIIKIPGSCISYVPADNGFILLSQHRLKRVGHDRNRFVLKYKRVIILNGRRSDFIPSRNIHFHGAVYLTVFRCYMDTEIIIGILFPDRFNALVLKGYPIAGINSKNLLEDFDDFILLQLYPSYGRIHIHCSSGSNPNH